MKATAGQQQQQRQNTHTHTHTHNTHSFSRWGCKKFVTIWQDTIICSLLYYELCPWSDKKTLWGFQQKEESLVNVHSHTFLSFLSLSLSLHILKCTFIFWTSIFSLIILPPTIIILDYLSVCLLSFSFFSFNLFFITCSIFICLSLCVWVCRDSISF